MKRLIYAVEDDAALQELYIYSLENDFECVCFGERGAFFNALEKILPDMVLLDVMLPNDDGYAILKDLKEDASYSRIPVIMVSAKGDEVSKVRGLNLGADDYIAKPFGVLELVARIKANLRRSLIADAEPVIFKDIVIDIIRHNINVNGTDIQTTLKEFNLLRLFCKNAERVMERAHIFAEVWGESFYGETRTLDIHVKELRKKLRGCGSAAVIETVRGVGYVLK